MNLDPTIVEKAARIKLLLMDVDGVLTDGRYFTAPGQNGTTYEVKQFNTQDGLALHWLHWYDIATGVISGRKSESTEVRAQQTKMKYVFMGSIEKVPLLESVLADSGLTPAEIGYVGDDFTDVVIMRRVGMSFATANARPEVKRVATVVLETAGGDGAIRETAEILLKAKGVWNEILRKYELID